MAASFRHPTRALAKGIKIDDIFNMAASLQKETPFKDGAVPLIAMISYSLVYHRGPAQFIAQARQAGFSGAIIPDLPVDESAPLARLAAAAEFALIHLVTPTTPLGPRRANCGAVNGIPLLRQCGRHHG